MHLPLHPVPVPSSLLPSFTALAASATDVPVLTLYQPPQVSITVFSTPSERKLPPLTSQWWARLRAS